MTRAYATNAPISLPPPLSLFRLHYYRSSFLQIAVRRRGTAHIQTRRTHALRRCACAHLPLFTHTRHTCPCSACTRLTYDETPATTTIRGNSVARRTLDSPRRPQVEEATLFFSCSFFSRLPSHLLVQYRATSWRARRTLSNRISERVASFALFGEENREENRNREIRLCV